MLAYFYIKFYNFFGKACLKLFAKLHMKRCVSSFNVFPKNVRPTKFIQRFFNLDIFLLLKALFVKKLDLFVFVIHNIE